MPAVSESHRHELPERIVLGRIVRAQGLEGALRVLPEGISPEISAQLVGKPVFLRSYRPTASERKTTLRQQRWHRGLWIVLLEGCSTRTEAESLVGCELCLAEEDRPALGKDEYYPDQLVGLQVVDVRTRKALGIVASAEPSAASDLLEVEQESGVRFVVPFVRALVKAVDLSAREVRVDLPHGLVEINRRTKDLP